MGENVSQKQNGYKYTEQDWKLKPNTLIIRSSKTDVPPPYTAD